MLFDNVFDLIVSIGEDCACSSYLRRFRLQDYSYPFDWLTKASFMTRIELLANDFSGFLEFENLKKLEKNPNEENDEKNDYYEDVKNHFHFYHDFKCDLPLGETFPAVKEKYNRRIKRLYEKINESSKILFVWRNSAQKLNLDEIKKAYNILEEKFKDKSIYLLLTQHNPKEEIREYCNSHVVICGFDNKTKIKNKVMGNFKNHFKVFRKIKKQRNLKYYFGYVFYLIFKVPVEIIPVSKNCRIKLRKKIEKFLF